MGKRFTGMLALAIVLMTGLIYLALEDTKTQQSQLGRLVFPELKANLEQITEIHISAGAQSVILEKLEGGWRLRNRSGYPVDRLQLARLLRALAEMVYLEEKTRNPERFAELGLGDSDGQQGAATGIELLAPNQRWALLVGAKPSGREGQYIRLPELSSTWLIDQTLALPQDPVKWLAPLIMNVDSARVRQVILNQPEGSRVVIDNRSAVQDGIESATITNLPVGASLIYSGVADEVTRALVNLRLQDVQAAENIDWQGAIVAQYELVDGKTLWIKGVVVDGESWISVALVPAFSQQERSAYDLSNNVENWAYKISQYDYQVLSRGLKDFVDSES